MGKGLGAIFLLWGIGGYLYQWILRQRDRERRREEFVLFLQKSYFSIETEKVKILDYFSCYESECAILMETLKEIARRLEQNIYPEGYLVWKAVFLERKKEWDMKKETFEVMLSAGAGFFGRNRRENLCFLQKNIDKLMDLKEKEKCKEEQERKVWIPVGMLGGIMVILLFI